MHYFFKKINLSWKTPFKVWGPCSAFSYRQRCIPLVLMAKPWAHCHSLNMASGMRCWRTKRSLSLRRQSNCLVLSELLVVCSSELLIACQLSLWLCMSLPQWDTGTETMQSLVSSSEQQQAAARTHRGKVAPSGKRLWHEETSLCHSLAAARGRCLRAGKSRWGRKHVAAPAALLHDYSCICLHDRCHWGKPTLLLLGLQSAGWQPRVNLLLEQGDLASVR